MWRTPTPPSLFDLNCMEAQNAFHGRLYEMTPTEASIDRLAVRKANRWRTYFSYEQSGRRARELRQSELWAAAQY